MHHAKIVGTRILSNIIKDTYSCVTPPLHIQIDKGLCMIVLLSLIVLLRRVLAPTVFHMVHPYITIHSVERFLHLFIKVSSSMKDQTLADVNDELLEAGEFLSEFTSNKMTCIQQFCACQNIVQWIRQTTKGTHSAHLTVCIPITICICIYIYIYIYIYTCQGFIKQMCVGGGK